MFVTVQDQLTAHATKQLVKPTAITQDSQQIQVLRQRRMMQS